MVEFLFIQASLVNSSPNAAPLTVYFDGACPVGSAEIAHFHRQPGARTCQWIDAAGGADDELGPGLTRDAALRRLHVRRADGELVDGMRGFAAFWQVLPRTAWLGRLASFGPMPWLLDVAYSVFLALRPRWRKSPPRIGAKSES